MERFIVSCTLNAVKALSVLFAIKCMLVFMFMFKTILIADLILDWMSSILGWIEAQTRIMSFSVNSETTDTIYTNLQHVNLLTINSHNG